MKDFVGNDLKLGDRVVTLKVGQSAFVAGEVVKLTPGGAKILTDIVYKGAEVWRPHETIQRDSCVIHLVERNPTREAELAAPKTQSV